MSNRSSSSIGPRTLKCTSLHLIVSSHLLFTLLLSAGTATATNIDSAAPALPVLPAASGSASKANGWQLPNPYRGDGPESKAILAAGAAAYEKHCSSCHGRESSQAIPEGPDLRRLNSVCLRLRDRSLVPRCLQDVDTYYLQSVLEGKPRAGHMHMPAWAGLLSQETIWAIRTFTESRPPAPRKTLPDLPPVRR